MTVALNGDGGDETFAGYERYAAMQLAERYRRMPAMLREQAIEPLVNLLPSSELRRGRVRDVKRFLRAASLPRVQRYLQWVSVMDVKTKSALYTEDFRRLVGSHDPAEILAPWFAKANGSGLVDALLLTDTLTYLPNELLAKVDIATMAVSLEARSPFLDHHVIEFAASLPENLKLRGLTTKYILKQVLKKLLPSENLTRRKMGFGVPIGAWFRGQFQQFLRDTLLTEKFLNRGIFNPPAIRQTHRSAHARRARSWATTYVLLMLELWYNRFIDS